MDQYVMTWAVAELLQVSTQPSRPPVAQIPQHGTRMVHYSYVDDVRFVGDVAVLSKASDGQVRPVEPT